jgi:3-deoxy-manno-octulosonate cytidylyltransferase (CMP-KDO synthetase)
MNEDVAIIIPSRLGSQRLYQKPLQEIAGLTIIEHMIRQVRQVNLEHIYIATDSELVAEKASNVGVKYIMTSPDCNSGTDRVYQAFNSLPTEQFNYIVNIQGDMPFIEPEVISKLIEVLKSSEYDIITPVTKVDIAVAKSESNVKVVVGQNDKALYFSRSLVPYGAKEFWYHVGIYGFKKQALERFVNLPQSNLEACEKLEQLRALENNIEIGVCYVDNIPISVDTPDDLKKALEFYNKKKTNF